MLETKYAPLDLPGLDAQSAADAAAGRVSGYAALFGVSDQSGDVIAPGAFARSLAARETPVKLLWQHDPARPIGVWETLTEDARGLRAVGRLCLDCQAGAEAAALLAAGALDGLSIGYRVVQAEQREQGRLLTEIDLWEISLVTFPMAEAARVEPAPLPPGAAPLAAASTPPPAQAFARALEKARAALR